MVRTKIKNFAAVAVGSKSYQGYDVYLFILYANFFRLYELNPVGSFLMYLKQLPLPALQDNNT